MTRAPWPGVASRKPVKFCWPSPASVAADRCIRWSEVEATGEVGFGVAGLGGGDGTTDVEGAASGFHDGYGNVGVLNELGLAVGLNDRLLELDFGQSSCTDGVFEEG